MRPDAIVQTTHLNFFALVSCFTEVLEGTCEMQPKGESLISLCRRTFHSLRKIRSFLGKFKVEKGLEMKGALKGERKGQ